MTPTATSPESISSVLLALRTLELAAELDASPAAHQCAYSWCDAPAGKAHFGARYTDATAHPMHPDTGAIGVVLDYDEAKDRAPYLVVTVRSKDSDEPAADAGLSLAEAIELPDILDTAISHVAGFDTVVTR